MVLYYNIILTYFIGYSLINKKKYKKKEFVPVYGFSLWFPLLSLRFNTMFCDWDTGFGKEWGGGVLVTVKN